MGDETRDSKSENRGCLEGGVKLYRSGERIQKSPEIPKCLHNVSRTPRRYVSRSASEKDTRRPPPTTLYFADAYIAILHTHETTRHRHTPIPDDARPCVSFSPEAREAPLPQESPPQIPTLSPPAPLA